MEDHHPPHMFLFRKMEELRGTSEGGLVGLGEKAKLLLGAAVAEPGR